MRIQRLIIAALLSAAVVFPQIRDNAAFKANSIPRNDDGSSTAISLNWTLNFFGVRQTTLWVNNNGNITFDGPLPTYTPFGLTGVTKPIIAPFFADVDTRPAGSSLVTYGSDVIDGRRAFGANWISTGYFNQHVDKLNSFQLVLIEREDTGAGNFDIEFNYQTIRWETGDASGGVNGFGGVPASVGWSNGTGLPGTSYELPGSLISGAFLDNGPNSLSRGRTVGTANGRVGRWTFRARGGTVIPALTLTTGCPIPNASSGRTYSFRFDALGSKPPYRWTATPDPGLTLPNLTLSSTGVMSGVPVAPGEYPFTVKVTATDEDGDVSLSQRCSITVDAPSLSFQTGTSLPATTTGARYTAQLRAEGGTGPYRYELLDSAGVPGLSLSTNGTLSGTAAAAGIFPIQVRARSESGDLAVPAVKRFSVNVRSQALSQRSSCPLPNGTSGVPYNHQLQVDGGSAPYRWSLAGQLPTGLSMTSDGRISGISNVANWWPFTLRAEDSAGASVTFGCGIVILFPEVQIASACPLPNALAGANYTQRLQAAGGSAPYSWSVAGGSLPTGLRLQSDGTLTGAPATAGAMQFRIGVSDSRGQTAAAPCSLIVNRGDYGITSCPLPDGYSGDPYTQQINATGGEEPYTFSAESSLPGGLRFSSAGVLSGLLGTGTYALGFRVTDRNGRMATRTCALQIRPQVLRMNSECPLPGGRLGQFYSFTAQAAGGQPPYAFSTAAALPGGLRLASNGTLSGTPGQAGSFSLPITITDQSNQRTTQSCTVSFDLPPLPDIRIAGLPAVLTPASAGPRFTVELAAAYPLPLDGEVSMSVQPDTNNSAAAVNQPDPSLRLTGALRTVPFTIAAGARSASFQVNATGTVASIATVAVGNLQAGGAVFARQINAVMRVARLAPVLTNVCYSPSEEGFTLDLSGYSTTRDLTSADLTFGSNVYTVDLTSASQEYFSGAESVRVGGTFRVTSAYRLSQGNAQNLGQGSAVIRNSEGASASRPIAKCN